MSDKSFEERRAALRERVKDQLEGKEPVESNIPDDGRNSELENEIIVKPMIDLDYNDRERLRMVVLF